MALLSVGDKAPAFATTDQDGKPVKLSDYKGGQEPDRLQAWALRLKHRRGYNSATVAMANKIAV